MTITYLKPELQRQIKKFWKSDLHKRAVARGNATPIMVYRERTEENLAEWYQVFPHKKPKSYSPDRAEYLDRLLRH